jgi:D-alanyl-D-alanine carboxypeptidase/D-alanyl-D-alanine-endopeptidase (penicillin-binding protein 4)
VRAKAFDSSGLSYENKISARGIVNLLEAAKERPWVSVLRRSLPKGGQGTLQDRFPHVRLRAKTGTLREVSTLSGWVWLKRANDWAEFSIMSRGLDKSRAVELENKIVRLLSRRGH